MSLEPLVSILIVNWNTRDYLRACLLSLEATCAAIKHEVIVVDNASHDGSAAMVRDEFPAVQLIANADNAGYAAGNDQAYAVAQGEWIWLLNPDTEVLDDALDSMLNFLQADAKRGAVASALIDAKTGKPQRSCRTFPTPAALWSEATGLARFYSRSRRFGFYRMGWWRYHDTRPVDQPMASSLLLRREAIEDAGGLFDEQFPIFFNDVDLCWRLWARGWQIWYLHQAQVLHHGGASTRQVKPEMIAASHRALRLFYEKHYRAILAPPVFIATVALMEASGIWRYRRAVRAQSQQIKGNAG
ncbi:MAG: glycosyltransferase [Abitibacteriaceae bacterium]|nr:glycosyltransferase [Abditibacteriaceae bacterium]MBV9867467.1 glycosyltransferase [Abditibacteriaceae bacterium]